MIFRPHPPTRRARVRTRPYGPDGVLVERLIADELIRLGRPEPRGATPLRPDEVSRANVEDPAEWFAADAEVLDAFDVLAKQVARRR
jgi:hypothetical protein